MTLKASDTKSVWRLSNELIRADSVSDLIETLFDSGRHLIPFDSAVLFPLDSTLFKPLESGHFGVGIDVNKHAYDYAQRYYKVDPLRVLEKPCNHNLALRIQDVMSLKVYSGSEIRQDFYHPIGIDKVMGICVVSADKPICGIGMHRDISSKTFSVGDRNRMTLLAPAISHGLARLQIQNTTIRALSIDLSDSEPNIAVWLLESPTKVQVCNAHANNLASSMGSFHRRHTKHFFPKSIQNLINQLAEPDPNPVHLFTQEPRAASAPYLIGEQWYLFTVTMIKSGLSPTKKESILITATRHAWPLDFDKAAQGLGLSKREKEIAKMVIRGLTNRDIATSLKIVEQTVKDHLRSVFVKAGVSSRAGLIARLINNH
ncbi:MAG: helix-turn-helix transcriptional regulator [Candidatus Thiodiazotropha sp.]